MTEPKLHWRTKLARTGLRARTDFQSLAAPTYRGSTVVFKSLADVKVSWRQREEGYSYGLHGTPTTLELAERIAELEGAHGTIIVPGGLSAISLVYLAFCRAGSHALVPANAYGPNRELGAGLLAGLGIEVEAYDPSIGAGIASLIRPETALIWCESPGSVTMEIQDVPAIAKAARARGVPVALDNTYAAGVLFDAFAHGVDVSVQALTKYVGGHSDLLLGSVSTASEEAYAKIGQAANQLGLGVSPDDCSLALRGLQTLGARLERLERSALKVAQWLAQHEKIQTVLHPALPSCPGHAFWKRDFVGSASLFSVAFRESVSPRQAEAFVDSLRLFRIGFSWGGVASLAVIFPGIDRLGPRAAGRLVRLNIGLEEPDDLIRDLERALAEI